MFWQLPNKHVYLGEGGKERRRGREGERREGGKERRREREGREGKEEREGRRERREGRKGEEGEETGGRIEREGRGEGR